MEFSFLALVWAFAKHVVPLILLAMGVSGIIGAYIMLRAVEYGRHAKRAYHWMGSVGLVFTLVSVPWLVGNYFPAYFWTVIVAELVGVTLVAVCAIGGLVFIVRSHTH